VLDQERLTLSIEETAGVLGISRALAYELVRREELPCLRLGRRIVVPRKALQAFVETLGASGASHEPGLVPLPATFAP